MTRGARATEADLDAAVATALFESGNPAESSVHTDGSVVSGVFSGADIELVVHMPNEDAMPALREVEELTGAMLSLEREFERIGAGSIVLRDDIEENIQMTSERIGELMNEVADSGAVTKTLAEVQTLSVSIHREKFPVRTLGSVYPRSYTRGPRTISGTMIFTVFHEHIFSEFLSNSRYRSTGVGDWDRHRWSTMITDQLPPLDVSIRFTNEYGNISWMAILGIEFVNEGTTMSIEDLFMEGVLQYVARDIDLIRNVANRQAFRNRGVQERLDGTQLLQSDLSRRTRGRRNPFV